MSFSFRCSACGKRLCGEDHQVGDYAPCPRCEVLLEIPDPRVPPPPTRIGTGAVAAGEFEAGEAPIRFRPSQRGIEAVMDMTPMVDVTFLLLIFFMVTAAFAMQKSFQIPAPEHEEASKRPIHEIENNPDYVIVRVDQFNTFHVSAANWDEEKEAPTEQDLLVRLREARARPAAATRMLVMASGEAKHERVVMALDAGTAVAMEDVKLITVEDEL